MSQKKHLVVFSIRESNSKFGDVFSSVFGTQKFKKNFVRDFIRSELVDGKGTIISEKAKDLLVRFRKLMAREELFVFHGGYVTFEESAAELFNALCEEFSELTDQRVSVELASFPAKLVTASFEVVPKCDSKSASTS